ncbi:hypothetical protein [Prosthecobacter sp.]|uniref:hypothetical protein n=1 Tax=Prosthecobacter sp. TaxID=1965333 RepID=UPI003783C78B
MNLRRLLFLVAGAACAGVLGAGLFRISTAQGRIMKFQTSDEEGVEIWIGNRQLGKTPLEISADQLKQIILAEFPDSDCAKAKDNEFGFVSNDDRKTTKFQFFYDGAPHMKFVRNRKEVQVKAGVFARSDSNVTRFTLTVNKQG